MRLTFRVVIACATSLLVVACAKKDQASADTAAAAAMPAPAPTPAPAPAASLADFAGKWQVRSVPESGKDTTPTNYVLTANADTTGWLITFPTGVKSKQHVMLSGDSVMAKSEPFASQRRKGAKVSTESSMRIQGGKLVGTVIAHYVAAGPDSVLHLRLEGTKMP